MLGRLLLRVGGAFKRSQPVRLDRSYEPEAGFGVARLATRIDAARQRELPHQLRAVASENVPVALRPGLRRQLPPEGRAMRKRMPPVVKRYRRTAHPPIISPRLRILKLTTLRPQNVIELTRALRGIAEES